MRHKKLKMKKLHPIEAQLIQEKRVAQRAKHVTLAKKYHQQQIDRDRDRNDLNKFFTAIFNLDDDT